MHGVGIIGLQIQHYKINKKHLMSTTNFVIKSLSLMINKSLTMRSYISNAER